MQNIQHFFVAAIRRYLTDLRARQKGRIIIPIDQIRQVNDLLYVYMREPATHPEALKLELNGEELPQGYRYILYDDYQHALVLSASESLTTLLLSTDVKSLHLVSDLYFLLERLQAWYEEHGARLSFPPSACDFPLISTSSIQLSDDQLHAVHTALSSPISYIWGAPGTGKTKAVLATCVLSYISQGLPILLAAPTNNAVDQMLRGVLEVLTSSGICVECVRRLGTPTQSFARDWPQVCHIGILDKLREKAQQLKQAREKLSSQLRLVTHLHALQSDQRTLQHLFRQALLSRLLSALRQHQLSQLSSESVHAREQLPELSFQIHWYMRRLHPCMRTPRHPFRHPLRRRAQPPQQPFAAKLPELCLRRSALRARLSKLSAQQQAVRLQLIRLQAPFAAHASALQSFLQQLSDVWALSSAGLTALDLYLSFASLVTSAHLDLLTTMGPDIPTPQRLQAELSYVTDQLEHVNAEYKRLASYHPDEPSDQPILVRAATIDTLLQSVQPDELVRHIFLDEAGYCSLARGASLLAWNAPITLLGDHMQLPPVYELSVRFQDKTTYAYIPFAQSVLYLESLFLQNSSTFFHNYFTGTPPVFSAIQVSALKYTYRYGSKLAAALDSFVYHFSLSSKATHETNIYAISVSSNSINKSSLPEANAILQWCRSNPHENAGILTPYRNQVKALRNALKHTNHRDEVYTIHRSQGREWDTVLLSVVDGAQYHFMMDSSIPKVHAQQNINTAVSRARKRLILVCDAEFWLHHPEQFLAALLRIAQPLSLPGPYLPEGVSSLPAAPTGINDTN